MSSAIIQECANVVKALKEQLDTIPTDLLKTSVSLPGALLPVAAAHLLLLLESTLLPFLDDPITNPATQNFFFATILPPTIGDYPGLAQLQADPSDINVRRFNFHEANRIRRKAELQCASLIVQAFSRTIGAGFNACILAPFNGNLPPGMAPPPPSLQGVTPWAAKVAFSAHYCGAVSATLDALERQLATPMADEMTLGVHISQYDIKVREMDAIGGTSRALSNAQSWRHTMTFIKSISHLARYAPFLQAYTDTGHTTDATRLWPDFKIWALQHAPAYEQQLATAAYSAAHNSSSAAAGPVARAPAARAPTSISLPVTTTGRISVEALKAAAANQGYVLTPSTSRPPNQGARQPNDRIQPRDRPPPAAPYNARQPQRPYQQPRNPQPARGAAPRRNGPQRFRHANAVASDPDADADVEYAADDDQGYESTFDPQSAHHTARAAYLAESQSFNDDDEVSDTDDHDGAAYFGR
jgi:hypothetical protein